MSISDYFGLSVVENHRTPLATGQTQNPSVNLYLQEGSRTPFLYHNR